MVSMINATLVSRNYDTIALTCCDTVLVSATTVAMVLVFDFLFKKKIKIQNEMLPNLFISKIIIH